MSELTDFFPGGGGSGGASIGDYGLKPTASGAETFTDPNNNSVWFKTGHTSTDTAAYPDFTPIFGPVGTYPQTANVAALAQNGNAIGNVHYNSVESKIFVDQWASYWWSNYSGYELDPNNIASGNWGTTAAGGAATSRYSFEPVADGVGNNYVLQSNGNNTGATTGSRGTQRSSNWLRQSILRIAKVSGGDRQNGYSFNQYITPSGIPNSTGPAYGEYQIPISFVATENFFYYSFIQQNPNTSSYLTYYYGDTCLNNNSGSLTSASGQQPNPSDPTKVFARIRCVKLNKSGVFQSEFTRPGSDAGGGGGALVVFTDPLSTGDSFWTLDKNSIQNGEGPGVNQRAGFARSSSVLDWSKTFAIRKHSEDGTVIKTAEGLPMTGMTVTAAGFAAHHQQQAFCTPDGSPHYFTAGSLAGNAAQTQQKAAYSPLPDPFNIIKLGQLVGDPIPRYANLPTNAATSQTGMGVNTSNTQIMSGPHQASFSPQQLYIRVA